MREVYPNRGGGIWEQHPERAIAGAIIYFGLMGLFELKQLARLPEATSGQADLGTEPAGQPGRENI